MKVKKRYSVICPVCERKLFKTEDASGIEVSCPKCKAKLEILMEDRVLQVRELEIDYCPDEKL